MILNCKKKTLSGHSREGGNLLTISVLNLDSGLLQTKTGMTVLHFIFSCVSLYKKNKFNFKSKLNPLTV